MDRYSNSYGDGMGTNSMPTTHSEIKAETEAEVETVLVLTKRLKLRTITGQITIGDLEVYECENPYLLIFLLTTEYYDGIRMDVHKDDLAKELRHWLQGKNIFNPVLFVPLKIDEAINNFVKFGKTPKQEDMIMWILSRSELYLGSESELVFGGRLIGNENSRGVGNNEEYQTLGNDMTRSMIGTKKEERIYEEDRPMKEATDESMSTSAAGPVLNSQYHNTMKTLSSASDTPSRTRPVSAGRMRPIDDPGKEMFATTKKLLGKSLTLEQLKKQKVQGRDGAAQSMSIRNWTTEQLLLCADIEKARKKIESSMDERRKAIEVVKARKIQSVERFKKIKEDFKEEHGKGKFITNARNELYGLQKMESDIRDDINRQKIRAQRDYQKMAWIKAPPGFDNLRGKSQRGPVLGKGPLPFNATSSLRDPAIEMTMKKYYWDTAGRRHAKNGNNEDEGNESLIEKAMDAIRKASSNVAAFKLDLRAVFEQFDTSGDGFLSPEEMAQGFLSMGVMLDVESMQAIFKHFDPNNSGSVHYGEFVWAFFNRRQIVRQWKRKTEGLTEEQITSKFHAADINGDGRLSPKEFKKFLTSFGMTISDKEIEILINRFDMDNDGDIDINEFRTFIDSEQKALCGGPVDSDRVSAALPQPKLISSLDRNKTLTKSTLNPTASYMDEGNKIASLRRQPTSSEVKILEPALSDTNVREREIESTRTKHSLPKPEILLEERRNNTALYQTHPARSSSPTSARTLSRNNPLNKTSGAIPDRYSHQEQVNSSIPAARYEDGNLYSQLNRDSPTEVSRTRTVNDVVWMTRMLQAQAEIESRLGSRYYQ